MGNHELTLKNLNTCFNHAYDEEAKYIAIMVANKENNSYEVIINSANAFPSKLKYFNEAYNEDLTKKGTDKIRIVGFTQADSYDEIQALLGV